MTRTARNVLYTARQLVIAHRGDSRSAPENTLPALLKAVRLDVDFVELDYHHSRDGVPIVFHDELLDQHTNARQQWPDAPPGIALADRTLSDLRQLDAGSWFSAEFVGTPISTLAEVCDAVLPHGMLAIERKSGDVATLLAVLNENAARQRCVVMAFELPFLAELHAADAELPLVALFEGEVTADKLSAAVQCGACAVGWDNATLTPAGIAQIHAQHLKAWCWTVDDRQRAAELWQAGLDGLITNVPHEMLQLRHEAKSPAPSATQA